MMYFGGGHMSGWGWMGAMVGMVFFWGLLAVLGVAAYRALGGGAGRRDAEPPADPRRILAERFARGQIDEDEYRSRLAALDQVVLDQAASNPAASNPAASNRAGAAPPAAR